MKSVRTLENIVNDVERTKRRWFFGECGMGLAGMAATSLLGQDAISAMRSGDANPLAPKQPHFPAKAKRVIYMFQAGAPSHLELFDNKPELTKSNGKLPPKELLAGYRAAFIDPNSALLGPKFKFEKHGQCGMELSEVLRIRPRLPTIFAWFARCKPMRLIMRLRKS